jgi:uncharacterized membrane protein
MYESGSTRMFKLGRTDTIRNTTPEANTFVKAMEDPNASVSNQCVCLSVSVGYLSVCCLSVCLCGVSVCLLSVCLSVVFLSVCLFCLSVFCLSVCLWFICLSVCVFCLSVVYLSVCLYVFCLLSVFCLSVRLSIFLPAIAVCLPVCLYK